MSLHQEHPSTPYTTRLAILPHWQGLKSPDHASLVRMNSALYRSTLLKGALRTSQSGCELLVISCS